MSEQYLKNKNFMQKSMLNIMYIKELHGKCTILNLPLSSLCKMLGFHIETPNMLSCIKFEYLTAVKLRIAIVCV